MRFQKHAGAAVRRSPDVDRARHGRVAQSRGQPQLLEHAGSQVLLTGPSQDLGGGVGLVGRTVGLTSHGDLKILHIFWRVLE
ncbi:MAG TPA: hypothetical protein VK691_10500 [Solirubrobacteraceae bacterium]|nr:hypothetical protein [Solirubrobacteraceae bacterium]